jgi:2-haloacid dehalogenase
MSREFDLILFDADGTLFDFAASERLAFETCLQSFVGCGPHDEAYRIYVEVSAVLWQRLEQGTLTKYELRERRWVELSERCRFALPAPEIAEAYLKELARHAHLIEGAVDVCRALAPKRQLGIVTNGFEAVQTARLAASPLCELIDFMVTSETAGAAKPAPAVFELALERSARPVQRERVLVVGDGITSDIAGGQRMGFATCWFNPTRVRAPHDIVPDYTITHLTELIEVLQA